MVILCLPQRLNFCLYGEVQGFAFFLSTLQTNVAASVAVKMNFTFCLRSFFLVGLSSSVSGAVTSSSSTPMSMAAPVTRGSPSRSVVVPTSLDRPPLSMVGEPGAWR